MPDRAVFTIATGKPVYLEFAMNLARSFKHWHPRGGIRFALVTDRPEKVPSDLHDIEVIPIAKGQYGQGFSPKLYLNELAPAKQSLFVDADCLCTGSLADAFDRFEGRTVSVIGKRISQGEWFGDIQHICRQFDVEAIPKFNGGVYYLESGAACDEVYHTAQELQDKYDTIGFVRLRGSPNDEVLMALAMALHGQEALPEDGTIMNSTLASPGGLVIDVLRGVSRLYNPPSHPEHNDWYDLEIMTPKLVHFLGYQATRHPYRREEIRLKKVMADGWPIPFADAWAAVRFSIPWLAIEQAKSAFRPLYHRLFGPREVKRGARSRFEVPS